jgi:hypothetical protein
MSVVGSEMDVTSEFRYWHEADFAKQLSIFRFEG